MQKARENNPGVRSKNASVRQQETQVELAHKNFRPDFNVQYIYEHTASEFRDYYMATFGIRLPNRGRQRAELAFFSREQIAAREENLDIAWLRDTSDDPEDELTEPEDIAAAISAHLKSALDEIEAYTNELMKPGEVVG